MANAPHDENFVKAKLGVLFSDGVTLIPIMADAVNGGLKTNTVDTVDPTILALYENGKAIPRDVSNQLAWCGTSNTDSTIIYPVFVDANGSVLTDE